MATSTGGTLSTTGLTTLVISNQMAAADIAAIAALIFRCAYVNPIRQRRLAYRRVLAELAELDGCEPPLPGPELIVCAIRDIRRRRAGATLAQIQAFSTGTG